MHDLDRTLSTLDPETDFETGFDDEMFGEGFDDEFGLELEAFETREADDFEANELEALRTGRPFSEDEEIELATELLAVQNEDELEMFVEGFFSKLRRKFKKFRKSRFGRLLSPIVKKLARRGLSLAGSAAGGYIGGPVGARIGGRLASGAGRIFGLELEGLAPEDQELEVARRVVRFAGLAAANATQAPEGVDDESALRNILQATARRAAPGLLRNSFRGTRRVARGSRTGRWIRRGRHILVIGA